MEDSYLEKLNRVYNKLEDVESKMVFEARLKLALGRNQDEFEDEMMSRYDDWRCNELKEKLLTSNAKGIVIYGCGHDGKRLKKHLEYWGYEIEYFCDKNWDKLGEWEGKQIISVQDMIYRHKEQLVIIASKLYQKEMYKELQLQNFKMEYVLLPKYGDLVATRGKQYFDVFEPEENEVFLDCGSYNGSDIFEFCEWSNWRYDHIYSFEPMKKMCEIIEERCKKANLRNVSVFNNAVWSKNEKLYFFENNAGSRNDVSGNVCVEGIAIDSVSGSEKATFIKMDIEGSELNALKGGRRTICEQKPRLAICIYHKDEDICEIGAYLLELVPEYKFMIRHYASNTWETVLYAYI